jgi:uncharacterized RmlC-like cupin family protein
MLEGSTSFHHGPNLEFVDVVEAGDYLYIPAGVPHQPFNPTDKIARALMAWTDPTSRRASFYCPKRCRGASRDVGHVVIDASPSGEVPN